MSIFESKSKEAVLQYCRNGQHSFELSKCLADKILEFAGHDDRGGFLLRIANKITEEDDFTYVKILIGKNSYYIYLRWLVPARDLVRVSLRGVPGTPPWNEQDVITTQSKNLESLVKKVEIVRKVVNMLEENNRCVCNLLLKPDMEYCSECAIIYNKKGCILCKRKCGKIMKSGMHKLCKRRRT